MMKLAKVIKIGTPTCLFRKLNGEFVPIVGKDGKIFKPGHNAGA